MGELGQYADIGHGYFTFPKLEGEIGPRMNFRGKPILNWSLNNYLGLANHPDIRKADADAAARWGLAYPMGSRMLTGNTVLHEKFEDMASQFVKKEDTFLLNYGYQGMVSIIQSLTDRKDVIVYDQLSHACILDGMSLSLAKRFVFRHNDLEQFEDRLKKATKIVEKTGGGILVITEGVFGMKGDMGDLAGIVGFKSKYEFRLLIDDAHGFGVMGEGGRGASEAQNVMDEVDLYFTTFAKSMAMIGAFVSGKKQVIHFLKYNLRSQIYAKSLPMPLVEGAIKRLEMLRDMPELRQKLWNIVNLLQAGLRERGFDIGVTQSPVTPVYLKGGTTEAAKLIMDMRENYGLFVSVVTYPVVEKGELMLRIIPTATHIEDDIKITLDTFAAVAQKLNSGVYAAAPPITTT